MKSTWLPNYLWLVLFNLMQCKQFSFRNSLSPSLSHTHTRIYFFGFFNFSTHSSFMFTLIILFLLFLFSCAVRMSHLVLTRNRNLCFFSFHSEHKCACVCDYLPACLPVWRSGLSTEKEHSTLLCLDVRINFTKRVQVFRMEQSAHEICGCVCVLEAVCFCVCTES